MFFSFAFDSLLTDCEIIENGTGFYASAGDGNQMHGCLIRGNQLGIYVQKEPNFTLTDTEFSGNWNTGARFTHADGSACIGCTFKGNWVSAMGLYSQGLLYQDNHFAGSENTSLYLQQVSGARLLENDFRQEGAAQPQYEDCENLLIWKETSGGRERLTGCLPGSRARTRALTVCCFFNIPKTPPSHAGRAGLCAARPRAAFSRKNGL